MPPTTQFSLLVLLEDTKKAHHSFHLNEAPFNFDKVALLFQGGRFGKGIIRFFILPYSCKGFA